MSLGVKMIVKEKTNLEDSLGVKNKKNCIAAFTKKPMH